MNGKPDYRIAIIDDSQAIVDLSRSTINRRMEQLGYEVEIDTFLKGKSFHSTLLEKKFDMVLIDYDMPTMNGLETVEKIRSLQKGMKYVFVVSRTFPDLLEALQQDKIFGVYIKNDLYFDNVIHLIVDQIKLKEIESRVRKWKIASQVLLVLVVILLMISAYLNWLR